jgi:DNA polymerase-3 subunit delta
MTAVKAADVARFVAKPDGKLPIVLVFGPDAGLVRERVDALIKASVDDPSDPFALARIDGDELAGNPSRLVEEAHTVPLFGSRRAVLVKVGSRNIAPAVETVVGAPSPECRVIIEAGNLSKNAPLRALCEKAKTAAALPCYSDNTRTLAELIDEEVRAAGLTIEADARAALIGLLGSDRLSSRSEIRKLTTYARDKKRIDLTDVTAAVADASEIALDGVIDAVFAGRCGEFDHEFSKARGGGSSPAAIISAAIRQVANLHKMRLAVDRGDSAQFAIKRATPPVHFTREPRVSEALSAWDASMLLQAMGQLAEASLEIRRNASLADAIAQRTLLILSRNVRTKA